MNHSVANISALCDELLLNIFSKLSNIDVLYSFIGINQRFDKLARDITFTQSIDLTIISSDKNKNSRTTSIFDRFYLDIIPKIQHNIECFTLDSLSMERVLCIGNYSKFHKLNLVNLEIEMAFHIFNDESSFLHIFEDQISHLAITISDDSTAEHIRSLATKIFTTIFVTFKNLTHLDFELEDDFVYPPLSLIDLPSTACYSSNIVELNVRVRNFDDCLCLLDGRLSQLNTFIIKIDKIQNSSKTLDNKKILYNLKCFSLISTTRTNAYDTQIVPLLHHMSQLEKLTLSLVAKDRNSFIDGTQLHNDILYKMAHLHTFIFDITTRNVIFSQVILPFSDDVRRTFIERGYHTDCYIDYYSEGINLCHVYSLPFTMKRMYNVTNSFPGGLFMNVRKLSLSDLFIPFEHDFFVKISQAFPLVSQLALLNMWKQQKKLTDEQTCSIIEYSHLVQLSLISAHTDYVKQFLFNSKSHLPCLDTLDVKYQDLITVTDNFTTDAARDNCAKLKNIIFDATPFVYSENFYRYFPSFLNVASCNWR
ncbi:unnamed protein product [Rotaria magnacalcarata]